MTLTLSTAPATETQSEELALLLPQSDWQAQAKAQLGSLGDAIVELASTEGFKAGIGQKFSTATLGQLSARRVTLIGLGKEALTNDEIRDMGGHASRSGHQHKANNVAVWAPWQSAQLGGDRNAALKLISEGLILGAYRFSRYLTDEDAKAAGPENFSLHVTDTDAAAQSALAAAEAVAAGVCVARDLGNEPPQVCDPAYLAKIGQGLADTHGFEANIFEHDALEAKGMNLLAAVGRGSLTGSRLIHLKYTGKGEIKRTLAFVGKGVTFDTGGYSLKISGSMLGMHLDMCGSAAVLGAAESIGRLQPEGVEIHFLVASAANMVSKEAFTVNEILKGYGGKTVEINNTDAEGRLCLADALAYAVELDVDEIIDLATLTGACVVALGEQYTGMFCNNEQMASGVLGAASAAGERLWRMPLDERLRDKLKSSVADMKNTGDRWGGAITAALFLKEWVGDKAWTHLDIAGPAMVEGENPLSPKGGSGVGVATLVSYALGQS